MVIEYVGFKNNPEYIEQHNYHLTGADISFYSRQTTLYTYCVAVWHIKYRS